MPHVTHLECANCGANYEAGKIHNLCTSCNRPLWVRYDMDALKDNFKKKDLVGRPPTLWRYLEMLPMEDPKSPEAVYQQLVHKLGDLMEILRGEDDE